MQLRKMLRSASFCDLTMVVEVVEILERLAHDARRHQLADLVAIQRVDRILLLDQPVHRAGKLGRDLAVR
jgi:hypothetical protein